MLLVAFLGNVQQSIGYRPHKMPSYYIVPVMVLERDVFASV